MALLSFDFTWACLTESRLGVPPHSTGHREQVPSEQSVLDCPRTLHHPCTRRSLPLFGPSPTCSCTLAVMARRTLGLCCTGGCHPVAGQKKRTGTKKTETGQIKKPNSGQKKRHRCVCCVCFGVCFDVCCVCVGVCVGVWVVCGFGGCVGVCWCVCVCLLLCVLCVWVVCCCLFCVCFVLCVLLCVLLLCVLLLCVVVCVCCCVCCVCCVLCVLPTFRRTPPPDPPLPDRPPSGPPPSGPPPSGPPLDRPSPGPPFPWTALPLDHPSPGPPFPWTALFWTALRRTAQNFALFLPSPVLIFVLFLSLGVFSWNFGGVFEGWDPLMCTFGLSGCRVKPRRLWGTLPKILFSRFPSRPLIFRRRKQRAPAQPCSATLDLFETIQDLATQWIQSYPNITKTSQETIGNLQESLNLEAGPNVIRSENSHEFGNACEDHR